MREEVGRVFGWAREDDAPVDGRWGLNGLVFGPVRSGGMVDRWLGSRRKEYAWTKVLYGIAGDDSLF